MENIEILQQKLEKINEIKKEISKNIIWQENLVNSIIIWLISGWHILLEWVPGLAKTLTAETVSKTMDLNFKRIQFTPDLLPSDLVGWEIYNQADSKFYTKKWPIFTNFLLADEINRAPTKVQSALLEAMQEKQVTIGNETMKLDSPFFVLATQNPVEQEWTYLLPEAQLDRFLLKVIVNYPKKNEEIQIMKSFSVSSENNISKIVSKTDILEIREFVEKNVFVDEKIYEYVKDIVFATREPEKYNLPNLTNLISLWASPRASINLIKTGKVNAFLNWRDYVIPEDIKEMAYEVLRHRIILSFEAIGENVTQDEIIKNIISNVKIS